MIHIYDKMDYKKLGFKCGIEIHQQLETHKLFCNCPSIVHDDNPDIRVKRKLRAVVGETGEVDAAAAAETLKGKINIYEGCSTSCCLVELDEEPPFPVNPEALEVGLTIAKLLNATIVDEIQFMRKTVVDGSNVSGFQRTGLIAYDGYIETSKGKVDIPIICLEEEAAKRIKDDGESITWRLDRLGVALVEIATDATIKDPEHAKETAERLGMMLRSTKKVKRGIGTIRQDVNVSISKGARVEIKGFQDLKSIPFVIKNEINRQQGLIKKKKKVKSEVRAAKPDGTTRFLRPMPGAARLYPETDVLPVRAKKIKLGKVDLIEDKIKRYKQMGLGKDLATLMANRKSELFESLTSSLKLKPTYIAEIILPKLREIKRKYKVDAENISDKELTEVLNMLDKDKIPKDAVEKILIDMSKGKKINYTKYQIMDEKEIKKVVAKIIKDNKGAPFGALMGKAMAALKGKADGKKVSDLIKKGVK